MKSVEERKIKEGINNLVFSLFNDRIPIAEKFYVEAAIDAALQRTFKEKNKVFYGIGIGTVNVSEIMNLFIDRYVSQDWELIIIIDSKNYSYGKTIKGNREIYSYETLIPLPEQKVGMLKFLIG